MKLFALRVNLYQEVALSFKKVGDPCSRWKSSKCFSQWIM